MTDPALPARKSRHDAFDGTRRRRFLDALGKSGCLRDAARVAKVSHQTVYDHQARDPVFARQCELALTMAGTDIELHAWERGVVGIEEPVIYHGEVVATRIKRSDAILRLLLQGAKPKKYGPNPGFTRKRLAKAERKQIEHEVRAEIHARQKAAPTVEEVNAVIKKRLHAIKAHRERRLVAEGWTEHQGQWIPPGWGKLPDSLSPSPVNGTEEVGDSV